jgi:hypothetical protein
MITVSTESHVAPPALPHLAPHLDPARPPVPRVSSALVLLLALSISLVTESMQARMALLALSTSPCARSDR